MLKNVIKEMNALGINVVNKAKSNLAKKNSSGKLSESLTYVIDDQNPENPVLSFYAEDYGKFVDQGVQGFDPGAMPLGSVSRFNKAPQSPYKFGSGNFKGKGSLRGAIDKWVVQKGIPAARDKEGKFIKRKSLVYLMSRSIWYTGIMPSYFFTNAQRTQSIGIQRKFKNAYQKDMDEMVRKELRKQRRRNGR